MNIKLEDVPNPEDLELKSIKKLSPFETEKLLESNETKQTIFELRNQQKQNEINQNFELERENLFLRHYANPKQVKPRKKNLECNLCGKRYRRNRELNNHIDYVHNRKTNYNCETCDRTFSEEKSLRNHNSTIHEGIRPFKCQICDHDFAQRGHLKTHISSVHEGERPFKCEICEIGLASKHKVFQKSYYT